MRISYLVGVATLTATFGIGAASAMVPVEPIWNLNSFASDAGGGGTDAVGRLNELYAAYNEEFLQLNPVAATFRGDHRFNHRWSNTLYDGYQRRSRALVEKYLASVSGIDPSGLTGQDRISYDVFKYSLEQQLDAFESGYNNLANLLPLNQMISVHNFIPQLGSGQSAQPFQTLDDYENWLKRSEGFAEWADTAIAKMRKGMRRDVVQPRVSWKRSCPSLRPTWLRIPRKAFSTRRFGPCPRSSATVNANA